MLKIFDPSHETSKYLHKEPRKPARHENNRSFIFKITYLAVLAISVVGDVAISIGLNKSMIPISIVGYFFAPLWLIIPGMFVGWILRFIPWIRDYWLAGFFALVFLALFVRFFAILSAIS
jgi:uncharacterized membrane protein